MWRNWTGDQSCSPAVVERPRSVHEVSAAVERAAQAGRTVRVAGAGHSFGDLVPTDGTLIDLSGLNRVLEVDRGAGLVRVQAGISIRDLNAALTEQGLALENLGDIDVQSIAGAISTATHGAGGRLRNIPSQVKVIELAIADGSTVSVSADSDPETFNAAKVSLGSLGVITELTLRVVPEFVLHGVDAPVPLSDVLDTLEERVDSNDHFEFYVFPHSEVALTRTNNRTDGPPKPQGRMRAYLEDVVLQNYAFLALCQLGRARPSLIPPINRLCVTLAGTRRRTDRSAAIFTSPRLVRFTEMENALPREHAAEGVRRVLDVASRFAINFPIEVRFVAPDDAFLSTAQGRESCYIAVHVFRGMEWEPYFRAVADTLEELGPRPHWGKRHFANAETLRPRYPDWDCFQAVRARLDPDGRFANAHIERVLGPVGARVTA